MSEDHLSEIDSILAEELPDLEQEDRSTVDKNQREDLIQLLQYAADELGKSPTVREYNSLDFEVSADVISNVFGTWNEAKEAAGLETWQRGTVRNIDETYFQSIDSIEKAYWFGTVLATSSLQPQPKSDKCALVLGRSEDKKYFVTEFADTVESDYAINRYDLNKSDKRQVQIIISNPTFVEHLLNAGYPGYDDDPGGFPEIDDEYRAAFLRGFLESSGYFSTGGWKVVVPNVQRAKTLQKWFEQYGAKRPTMSQKSDKYVVRVSNSFDIRAVFESLWPDILNTEPSWRPYVRKILRHLESEYPYPENLSYLSG